MLNEVHSKMNKETQSIRIMVQKKEARVILSLACTVLIFVFLFLHVIKNKLSHHVFSHLILIDSISATPCLSKYIECNFMYLIAKLSWVYSEDLFGDSESILESRSISKLSPQTTIVILAKSGVQIIRDLESIEWW